MKWVDKSADQHVSKSKLLDAALHVFRAKEYSAARIEDVCEVAGLTKGSFFHHFRNKEDLALAALEQFGTLVDELFGTGRLRGVTDPVERLLAYVDGRIALLHGELPDITCLAGTLVQETYATHPPIRKARDRCIRDHAAVVVDCVSEAMEQRGLAVQWSAESLGLHIQAVVQGAYVLAKAQGTTEVAVASLRHLRRYLECLFAPPSVSESESGSPMQRKGTAGHQQEE